MGGNDFTLRWAWAYLIIDLHGNEFCQWITWEDFFPTLEASIKVRRRHHLQEFELPIR
jgi:hypothetical protein